MQDTKQIADRAGFSGERLSRLDRVFEVDISRGLLPGAVLLIERKGQTVLRRAWGYRDRAAGTRMTTDTIFRIYSMTKPMVSVVTMMLAAEGRLSLAQPISDFIPSFVNLKVWTPHGLVTPIVAPTVHDLLRHTAGLIYGRRDGPVDRLYQAAYLFAGDMTNEEFGDRIATLPLAHQPGRVWDYSHATDVLGRVVEIVAGRSLGQVLRQRLFEPLRMVDTGFGVPEASHVRIAEPLPGDSPSGDPNKPMFDPRQERALEAGGSGLVSTLDDYARFLRMLLAGGTQGRSTFLSKASLRFMTADHIGPATGIARLQDALLSPGVGFGLGFAVRTDLGGPPFPGSVGTYNWSGIGGTYFWVDPARDLFAILLTQAPRHRARYREIVQTMVYDALVGASALKAGKRSTRQTD